MAKKFLYGKREKLYDSSMGNAKFLYGKRVFLYGKGIFLYGKEISVRKRGFQGDFPPDQGAFCDTKCVSGKVTERHPGLEKPGI